MINNQGITALAHTRRALTIRSPPASRCRHQQQLDTAKQTKLPPQSSHFRQPLPAPALRQDLTAQPVAIADFHPYFGTIVAGRAVTTTFQLTPSTTALPARPRPPPAARARPPARRNLRPRARARAPARPPGNTSPPAPGPATRPRPGLHVGCPCARPDHQHRITIARYRPSITITIAPHTTPLITVTRLPSFTIIAHHHRPPSSPGAPHRRDKSYTTRPNICPPTTRRKLPNNNNKDNLATSRRLLTSAPG